MNGLAGHSGAVDAAIRFVARYGVFVLGAVALGFGVYESQRSFRRASAVAIAMAVAAVIGLFCLLVAGSLVSETRPFMNDRDTVRLSSHSADNSFPSDHATAAAAMAGVASLAWRRWATVFVVLAFLAGLARVAVGLHYPGDVAAGWAIGAGAAIVGWLVVQIVVGRAGAEPSTVRA